ncbi:hypothetical protein CAP31_03740 [Sulfuriferula sp. AH1]|nr:hypothetical protein CAP31_03740 [Sulfuriferula sp. AH1]
MKLQHNRAVNKADVSAFLESLATASTIALATGGEVMLPDICKISVTTRAARTGRNPATGAEVEIPAKRVPAFKAVKALKDAVA